MRFSSSLQVSLSLLSIIINIVNCFPAVASTVIGGLAFPLALAPGQIKDAYDSTLSSQQAKAGTYKASIEDGIYQGTKGLGRLAFQRSLLAASANSPLTGLLESDKNGGSLAESYEALQKGYQDGKQLLGVTQGYLNTLYPQNSAETPLSGSESSLTTSFEQ